MRKVFGFLAVMMFASTAFANVAVHDNAGVIPQPQQNALIAEGSRWPFDLHVLTGAFGSPQALDAAVHRCVTGPNVVCIGVDPVHHKTNVHVGTGVGIPSSEFHSIAAAGNSNFKSGDYQGGIEAIATRAREAAHTVLNVPRSAPVENHYVTQQPVQVHIDSPVPTGMTTGWWLFLFVMIALVGIVIYAVHRALKTAKKVNEDMNDFRDEAFEMSSRNMNAAEEREFHEKLKAKITTTKPMVPTHVVPSSTGTVQNAPVVPQAVVPAKPTTVVHNHYGTTYNPTLTGSVMTDVLLADALIRPSTPVVVATPAPVVVVHDSPAPVDDGGSSSNWNTKSDDNDSGGSSSSHDDDNDSGGSSSSWDSGSSSSDSGSSSWDSGSSDSGSSDSGSSGGDSGGGGSDW